MNGCGTIILKLYITLVAFGFHLSRPVCCMGCHLAILSLRFTQLWVKISVMKSTFVLYATVVFSSISFKHVLLSNHCLDEDTCHL